MAAKKPSRKTRRARASTVPDAIALLKADHKHVDEMFKSFDKMKDNGTKKAALVSEICRELKVHTTIEEEIFYPAARGAIKDHALLDEADIEHASAKQLIQQLETMQPGDDHYDARVVVLGEYIRHHVKEEHEEMFPKVRKTRLDLKDLGSRMLQRKTELQQGGNPALAL